MAELAELSTSQTKWRGGRLLHTHIAPAASVKMQELAEANFVAGRRLNFPCKYLEKLLGLPVYLIARPVPVSRQERQLRGGQLLLHATHGVTFPAPGLLVTI